MISKLLSTLTYAATSLGFLAIVGAQSGIGLI